MLTSYVFKALEKTLLNGREPVWFDWIVLLVAIGEYYMLGRFIDLF